MSFFGTSKSHVALTTCRVALALTSALGIAGCVGSGGAPSEPDAAPATVLLDATMQSEAGSHLDAASAADAPGDAEEAGANAPPTASLSTAAIDFGSVNCGTSPPPTEMLTVTNTGGANLVVSGTVIGSAFALSGGSTLSLPPNGSGTLTLTATVPSSAIAGTAITGSLALFTNDPSGPDRVLPISATPNGGTLTGTALYVFPSTPVGVASTPVAIQLTNTGSDTATFGVGTPTNAAFTLNGVPSGGIALHAGQSWDGTATFTPTSTVTALGQANITATSGATCGTSVPALLFNGSGTQASLSGWPSTNSIDFGQAYCGGSAPPSQTITIANSSSSVAAHILAVNLSQANGFTTSVTDGATIPAGGTLPITFNAQAVPGRYSLATISGTIVLATDAQPSALTLTMTEEPQGAVLAFDTSGTTNFGSFSSVILLQSSSQALSVVNTGNQPASVILVASENDTSAEADGGEPDGSPDAFEGDGGTPDPFSLSTASFGIAAGGTQQESVTFHPLHANATVGTLGMEVSSGSVLCAPLPAALPLSGSAVGGGPDVTPTSLLFPATCGGSTPSSQTVFVVNDGTVDMSWTMSGVSGAGSGQFTVTSSPSPGLLVPGAFATLTVKAAAVPSPAPHPNPAESLAQLTITTDVPFDPPHVISLSEVPLGDQLSVSTSGLRYGQIPLNTSIAQSFTLTNNANAGSQAATVSVTPSSSAYSVQSGGTVAAGASVDEMVTFDPTAAQPYPGSLGFTSGDPQCTPLPEPVVLSGTGTAGALSLSATTLTFGTNPSDPAGLVNCGATGTPRALGLSNVGNQALNIVSATLGQGSSSPFSLSGPGATTPLSLGIGGSSSITITPAPIPQSVANPNDPSAFSDVLTITTDVMGDTPHTVTLVMQPSGAVIASTPFQSTWAFGLVGAGSIGTFVNTIQNTGNAPASVALTGLSLPQVFGLANNPTTASANAVTDLLGQFTPQAQNGTWADQGQLVVSAAAFCQPLPSQWTMPTVDLSGTSSASPLVTVSGTLTFPTTNCGSAAPGGQAISLTNQANQAFPFTSRFNSGAFYTAAIGIIVLGGDAGALDAGAADATTGPGTAGGMFGGALDGGAASTGSGTIPANGVAVIVVTPNTVTPGPHVLAGSAPYADDLIIQIASSPATSFTVPVSWGLNGAVLSLPDGLGPDTDPSGHAFYPADSTSGFALPIDNTGTGTCTVSFGMNPAGAFSFSPSPPITVEPGILALPVLSSTSSDGGACPTLTPGFVTFLYSGPVCQPLPYTQVNVESCVGTY